MDLLNSLPDTLFYKIILYSIENSEFEIFKQQLLKLRLINKKFHKYLKICTISPGAHYIRQIVNISPRGLLLVTNIDYCDICFDYRSGNHCKLCNKNICDKCNNNKMCKYCDKLCDKLYNTPEVSKKSVFSKIKKLFLLRK